ncbi:hypothetical protein QBC45DRAFT_394107 [Copromyces sp. CBS 386.78]|nr:hypothetical protein QBC45DRAFT_394107 [Copromyces sp. CBS 386.78]
MPSLSLRHSPPGPTALVNYPSWHSSRRRIPVLNSRVPRTLVPSGFFVFIITFVLIFSYANFSRPRDIPSTKSQLHRELASGLFFPVDFIISHLLKYTERADGDEGPATTSPGRASAPATHCPRPNKTPEYLDKPGSRLSRASQTPRFGLYTPLSSKRRVLLPDALTKDSNEYVGLLRCDIGDGAIVIRVEESDQYTTSKNAIL